LRSSAKGQAQKLLQLIRPVPISAQPYIEMNQGASLQETIAKGKRHYYDGLTFRKWKIAMLNLHGHDATPFLEEAWNAIIGEAESRARANHYKQTTSKSVGAGTSASAKPGPLDFLGNATMLTLNAIACLALFSAWKSGLPYSFDTKLTWICFAAFSYTALWRMKDGAALLCLPLACLFNPFHPVHLTRSVWSVIDVVSLLLLIAISFSFLASPKK
jgi:hypothetical protein